VAFAVTPMNWRVRIAAVPRVCVLRLPLPRDSEEKAVQRHTSRGEELVAEDRAARHPKGSGSGGG
jgi:hypothetical protein